MDRIAQVYNMLETGIKTDFRKIKPEVCFILNNYWIMPVRLPTTSNPCSIRSKCSLV